MADALMIVLEAAAQRAAELEHHARQPFTVLSAQTPAKSATAWAAKQAAQAAAIRSAITELLDGGT